jgi:putative transposase
MMVGQRDPSDLTDEQGQIIEPLLPDVQKIGHPRTVNLREIVQAIFYVESEGIRWRALPKDFPAWQKVYGYLRRWQTWGVWKQVHARLREQLRKHIGKDAHPTAAIVDSQSVKRKKGGKYTVRMELNTLKVGSVVP